MGGILWSDSAEILDLDLKQEPKQEQFAKNFIQQEAEKNKRKKKKEIKSTS